MGKASLDSSFCCSKGTLLAISEAHRFSSISDASLAEYKDTTRASGLFFSVAEAQVPHICVVLRSINTRLP